MAMSEIQTADVQAALAEFDAVGRDRLLSDLGFGPAQDYYIRSSGRFYDIKPIVAIAHRIRTGVLLTPDDFHGGKVTAEMLRRRGFVVSDPNPDWTRDEIVLACELVYRNGWRELDDKDPEIVALSALLQRMSSFPLDRRGPKFRNANGVARKTSDIMTSRASYSADGRVRTKGNKLDGVVAAEFESDPDRLLAEAAAIREAAEALGGEAADEPELPDPDLGNAPATEGGVRERRHLQRERDPKLRKRKIAAVLNSQGRIACEACGFDFAETYGQDRGREFIECHHTTPLSVTGKTQTRLEDLALLCSNCHRMIHVRPPWLTVAELRQLIAAHARGVVT